jgi:AcrR family transcriptional regulator
MRADAQRNRARILEVAFAAFAADGLSVPVHEIARRAGVGTGTVSRHFPTKEALFEAIIVDRAAHLMDRAEELRTARPSDPGTVFFGFFCVMVEELTVNRGLAEALAGAGLDLEAAVAGSGQDVTGVLSEMLLAAQRAGAVRPDVDLADIKALMTGCLHAEQILPTAKQAAQTGGGDSGAPTGDKSASDGDLTALRRRVEVVCAGLSANHDRTSIRVTGGP